MIELANILLLGGLFAAALPVLIHLVHRRRQRVVRWGAMRFLDEALRLHRRRLSADQFLLMALRMLAIVCLALALTRPQLAWRGDGAAGIPRPEGGRCAAVLLIDDSLSASARSGAAFAEVKALAAAYLATLAAGDEISLITRSTMGGPPADPLYDLTAARERLAALQPTAMASDVPALLDAGLDQLARHINPHAELVLASDGMDDGWDVGDGPRWEALRQRLRGGAAALPGSRQRPHLLLLAPEPPTTAARGNLAVTAIGVERALIQTGRAVPVRVALRRTPASRAGDATPARGALLRLLVDGRPVAERAIDPALGASGDLVFTHAFADAGSHLLEAAIEGAADDLAGDDRRACSVEVASHLPVLLIEGRPGSSPTALDGSLGLVAAALAPGGAPAADPASAPSPDPGPMDPSSAPAPDSHRIERLAVIDAGDAPRLATALARARTVVVGDVPALDAATVAALERFVVGGGGLLVSLGARTDAELVNRFWWRHGDGFLPCAIGALRRDEGGKVPRSADPAHPALAAFAGGARGTWDEVRVGRWFGLPRAGAVDAPADLGRIVALADGDPLVVERPRGLGRVALIATALDGTWTDLPYRAAFVPLLRALVTHLGGSTLPSRNLLVGERLVWNGQGAGGSPTATLHGPDGAPLPVDPGAWEDRPALISAPLEHPGGYALRTAGSAGDADASVIPGAVTARYAVATSPGESRLESLTTGDLGTALHGVPHHRCAEPVDIATLFSASGGTVHDLWRYLVAACLVCLVAETALTRHQATRGREARG